MEFWKSLIILQEIKKASYKPLRVWAKTRGRPQKVFPRTKIRIDYDPPLSFYKAARKVEFRKSNEMC